MRGRCPDRPETERNEGVHARVRMRLGGAGAHLGSADRQDRPRTGSVRFHAGQLGEQSRIDRGEQHMLTGDKQAGRLARGGSFLCRSSHADVSARWTVRNSTLYLRCNARLLRPVRVSRRIAAYSSILEIGSISARLRRRARGYSRSKRTGAVKFDRHHRPQKRLPRALIDRRSELIYKATRCASTPHVTPATANSS